MLTKTQQDDSTDSINQNVPIKIAGRNINTHNENSKVSEEGRKAARGVAKRARRLWSLVGRVFFLHDGG